MVFNIGLEVIIMIAWKCEMVVEANLQGTGFDFPRPVGNALFPKSQMPFANVCRAIPLFLQEFGQGEFIHPNRQRAAGFCGSATQGTAAWIGTRHQGIPRRRADGTRRIGLRKAHPLPCHPVNIRCLHL